MGSLKIFDASRMTVSGIQPPAVECDRQRSGNSVRDYAKVLAGPRVLGLELARWRAGRSEDAATEEPKHRSIARTLFHDSSSYKTDSRVSRPTPADSGVSARSVVYNLFSEVLHPRRVERGAPASVIV